MPRHHRHPRLARALRWPAKWGTAVLFVALLIPWIGSVWCYLGWSRQPIGGELRTVYLEAGTLTCERIRSDIWFGGISSLRSGGGRGWTIYTTAANLRLAPRWSI